jgi:hypothetical protein
MLNDGSISAERLHSFAKSIYFDAVLALNQSQWSPITTDLLQKLMTKSSNSVVFNDIFDFARSFENEIADEKVG